MVPNSLQCVVPTGAIRFLKICRQACRSAHTGGSGACARSAAARRSARTGGSGASARSVAARRSARTGGSATRAATVGGRYFASMGATRDAAPIVRQGISPRDRAVHGSVCVRQPVSNRQKFTRTAAYVWSRWTAKLSPPRAPTRSTPDAFRTGYCVGSPCAVHCATGT